MEKANLADKYAILQDDMETRNGPKVERARCIWPVTLLLLALSIFAVVYFFYPIKDDGKTVKLICCFLNLFYCGL